MNAFANLKALDTNADNKITVADAAFSALKIWRDLNADGQSQSSELFALTTLGITSINATANTANYSINGNPVILQTTFTMNGVNKTIADVKFVVDQMNSEYQGSVSIDPRVLFMPDVRGYGNIKDLSLAMSLDNTLLQKVQEISSTPLSALFAPSFNLAGKLDAMLYQWAGVQNVNPVVSNGVVDGRDRAFIEAFTGTPFLQNGVTQQGTDGGSVLSRTFDSVSYAVLARILAQSSGQQLFLERAEYNPRTDGFDGTWKINTTAISNLMMELHPDAAQAGFVWMALFQLINHTVGLNNLTAAERGALDSLVQQYDGSDTLMFTTLQQTIAELEAPVTSGWFYSNNRSGDASNNYFIGYNFAETINGNDGNDMIFGGNGNDALSGGNGNDVLAGEAGKDTLAGGAGNDLYLMDNIFTDTINEAVNAGTDVIRMAPGIAPGEVRVTSDGLRVYLWNTANPAAYITLVGASAFVDSQGSRTDVVSRYEQIAFTDGTVWDFTQGVRLIDSDASNSSSLRGSLLNDYIYGNGGNDALFGYEGNDYLDGGSGDDVLYGRAGDDTYIYLSGRDTIYEASGNDTIRFDSQYDASDLSYMTIGTDVRIILQADIHNIQVVGHLTAGNATRVELLQFSDGFSLDFSRYSGWISNGTGTANAETLIGNTSANTINAAGGNDEVSAGGGNDIVTGGDGDDRIHGGDGSDILNGNNGNDTLWGGNDADTLYGDADNDVIYGGAGADILYGGTGADTFRFDSASLGTIDTIKDFNTGQLDKLHIGDILIGYDPLTRAITDFIELTTSGANTIMKIDRDGSGTMYSLTQMATLENVTGLTDERALLSSGNIIAC